MTIVPNIEPTLLKGTPKLLVSVVYIDEALIADVGARCCCPIWRWRLRRRRSMAWSPAVRRR